MIVCYQWWFTPSEIIKDEWGDQPRILFSKRPPQNFSIEKQGTYHEVMAIWKIKNT